MKPHKGVLKHCAHSMVQRNGGSTGGKGPEMAHQRTWTSANRDSVRCSQLVDMATDFKGFSR